MSPIQFKFSKPPDGLVRRVTFPETPSWETLAGKIQVLYDIPLPSIGVSYVDNDGDEVTLSSEDELQDFYHSLLPGKDGALILVRLNVRDLDSLRSDKPLPDTPRTGSAMNYRNTFGRSAPVLFEMEVEDGWQPIPSGLGGMYVGGQPHAFVEVLDSDADIAQYNNRDNFSTSSGSTNTLPEINPTPTTGKGKGRARSISLRRSQTPDTISSTPSIVAAESGPKHPIHVVAMKNSSTGTFHGRGSRSRSTSALSPRTPTPKIRTPISAAGKSSGAAQDDDPPLPDLDNIGPPQHHIANDVADLFSTLSTILTSHPELSEGIRTIVRNASNGAYWQTHREQVVRAAEEIRRSVIMGADEVRLTANDGRRDAEEAAGRRVADALGEVIRAIADITSTQAVDPNTQSSSGLPPPPVPPPAPGAYGPFGGRGYPDYLPDRNLPGPPPHYHGRFGRPPFGPHFHHHHPGEWDNDDPFVGSSRGGHHFGGWNRHRHHDANWGDTPKDVNDSPIDPPVAPEPATVAGQPAVAPPPVAPQPPQVEPTPQIISNARGPFPQLELYSIPRRSHTIHGTGHRRDASWGTFGSATGMGSAQAGRAAAVGSIVRRLGEMGFTRNEYPGLKSKVDAHIPLNGEVSKEREESIVTAIVEELLLVSPSAQQAPQASSSGIRRT
ncbi:hypothetical protein LXA43DRAFT_892163 [Ganoderma leucocontextum]|nr:hypothetical protein LXA43DRAFT_892163 [Ganoderma leucocontextum]